MSYYEPYSSEKALRDGIVALLKKQSAMNAEYATLLQSMYYQNEGNIREKGLAENSVNLVSKYIVPIILERTDYLKDGFNDESWNGMAIALNKALDEKDALREEVDKLLDEKFEE